MKGFNFLREGWVDLVVKTKKEEIYVDYIQKVDVENCILYHLITEGRYVILKAIPFSNIVQVIHKKE